MRDPSVTIRTEPQKFRWVILCLIALLLIPLLCIVGELGGLLLPAYISQLLIIKDHEIDAFYVSLLGGLITGLIFSAVTWDWLPDGIQEQKIIWYVVTTLSVLVGSFTVNFFGMHDKLSKVFNLNSLPLLGAICGGVVGLSQLAMLKKRPMIAWLWLPAVSIAYWLVTQACVILVQMA